MRAIDRSAMIADYQAGMKYAALAAKHGMTVTAVANVLSRRGVIRYVNAVHPSDRAAMWDRIEALPFIAVGQRVIMPKQPLGRRHQRTVNHDAFALFGDTEAYWAGLLMSDGYVNERGDLVLQLQTADRDHVYAFRDFLASDHAIMYLPPTMRYGLNMTGAYRYAPRSHQIVADLRRVGITPRKSLTACAEGGIEHSRHFWRGIIDGDGNVGFSKNGASRIRLACAPYLVGQFDAFISRILPEAKPYIEQRGTILRLDISGKMAALLSDALYAGDGPRLARKYGAAKAFWAKHPAYTGM